MKIIRLQPSQRDTLILFIFVLIKFYLQFTLINPVYELQRDEYLYLNQGLHPAWGFLSVPPVSSWLAWMVLALGSHHFWIKFFPALFGALTIVIVWQIVRVLNGGLFSKVLTALALTFSIVMLRINGLFQPTSLDVLCWTLLYYTLVKYASNRENKWLILSAIVFALGFLNKYNIVFLLPGLAAGFAFSRQRVIFSRPMLYISAAFAFLLVLPNLYWQFTNHLPVIHHMKELRDTQLLHMDVKTFITEQVLYFSGSILLIIAALVALLIYAPYNAYRFVLWSFIITISLFAYCGAKGYYAAGLYPVLIAFGANYIERVFNGKMRVVVRATLVVYVFALFLPVAPVVLPVLRPNEIARRAKLFRHLDLLRWEDGKEHSIPQDFADMLGWRELSQKTDSIYQVLSQSGNTLIICDNYGEAGAINFYSGYRLKAISYDIDYIDWFRLDKEIRNVVLVKEALHDKDPERNNERQLFHSVTLAGRIENPYARETETGIFALSGATTPILSIVEREINASRKQWQFRRSHTQ